MVSPRNKYRRLITQGNFKLNWSSTSYPALLCQDIFLLHPPWILNKVPVGISGRERRDTQCVIACCISSANRAQAFCWEVFYDVALSEQQASGLDVKNIFLTLYRYYFILKELFTWLIVHAILSILLFPVVFSYIHILIQSSCIGTLAFLLQICMGPSEWGYGLGRFDWRPLFSPAEISDLKYKQFHCVTEMKRRTFLVCF